MMSRIASRVNSKKGREKWMTLVSLKAKLTSHQYRTG